MAEVFQANTKVGWDWGQGTATGYIREVFREKVTRTIKGSEVTRNASEDNRAYLIAQQDGGQALKSHSELRRGS